MLSILIPAYNEAHYIEECIDSILAQPFQAIELIIVNDGSTDDTWEKMQEIQRKDARIQIFNPGKLGKNGAFNYAFAQSRGEWITFMAGDDRCGADFYTACAKEADRFAPLRDKVYLGGIQHSFSDDEKYVSENDMKWKPPAMTAPFSNTLGMISRALAQECFPLPLPYPNEDTWLALCYRYFSDTRIQLDVVQVEYRIHDNNSYDHNGSFKIYSEAYNKRRIIIKEFCDRYQERLTKQEYDVLMGLYQVECLRYQGRIFSIPFVRNVSFVEKIKAICFGNALLNTVKKKTTWIWSRIPH